MINAGIPVVIGINTLYTVAEIAANAFNRILLCRLLNGWSIKYSFNQALNYVRSSEYDCKICCCQHTHTKDCLWQSIKTNTGKKKLTRCILGLANVTISKTNSLTPNSITSSMNLDAPNEHSIRNFTAVLLVKILKTTPKSKKN